MAIMGTLLGAFGQMLITTSKSSARTEEQATLQDLARTAISGLTRDLREATNTLGTSPVESLSGTTLTFDAPDEATPFHLRRISYRLVGGELDRSVTTSLNTEQCAVAVARHVRPVDRGSRLDHERLDLHVLRRDRRSDHRPDRGALGPDHARRRAEAEPGRHLHVLGPRLDQDGAMTRARHAARRQDGFAMIMAVAFIALLGILATSLIDVVQAESTHSRSTLKRDAAYEAAEAGVDDYISKLIDDRLYYAHFVHPGESTRLRQRPARRRRPGLAAGGRQHVDVSAGQGHLVRRGPARQRLRVQHRGLPAQRELSR